MAAKGKGAQMSDLTLRMWVTGQQWLAAALRRGERGQGMAEYALVIALVSIAAILILGTLGGNISNVFNRVSTRLATALG
jgi:pilus assembly protein Flp/PilA